MSRKFYAINRETGERWKKPVNSSYDQEYLVMYDSGYLAVVKSDAYNTFLNPLPTSHWKKVTNS